MKLPSSYVQVFTYDIVTQPLIRGSNAFGRFQLLRLKSHQFPGPLFFSVQERTFVLKTGGRRPQEAVKPLKRPHHKACSLVGNGPLKCCHNIRSVFDGHRSNRLYLHTVLPGEKKGEKAKKLFKVPYLCRH